MQYAIGSLSTLCVALIAILAIVVTKFNNKIAGLEVTVGYVASALRAMKETIASLPSTVQNIIHLGLKDGQVTTDLVPVALAIRPEDFQVNANLLYDALLYQMEEVGKRQKNCPDTWACCIIQNSGIQRLLDNQSFLDAWQALIRLLINGDKEATLRFLRTLADSVANVTAPAIEPTPAK